MLEATETGDSSRVSVALLRDPGHFLALGFGAGLSPRLPGTVGTIAGVLIYLPLQHLPLLGYVAVWVMLFAVGVWICGRTATRLGMHDHRAIVWDEIVGYLATMTGAPAGWPWVLGGFLLFRLFDIWKPWPAGLIDRRLPGGTGIMADDLAAAIYAGAVVQIIAWMLRG